MVFQRLLEQRSKVTRAQQRAYASQINRLISRTGKFEREKVDKMIDLLNRARADMLATLAELPRAQKFGRSAARAIKSEIERAMAEFTARAEVEMSAAQQGIAELAQDFTDSLIRSQARKPPAFGISDELIELASEQSADLVRSLSARQIGRATDIINRGVISGRSNFEVARDMSREFKKGLAQMETIARTQILGVHGQVQYSELLAMEATTPGLRKQWITVMDERTRETHKAVHLTSLPVHEPFQVGDAVLQYPRDPGGMSAAEIINCRCSLTPDFSDVKEEEPLSELEMPPVEVKLGGLARKVAKDVKKGFRTLR